MTRYIVWRFLQAGALLIGALIVNFCLIHIAPGDPIHLLAGDAGDEAYFAAMRAHFGLNQPLTTQLSLYLWNALHGEFGYSYAYNRPVFEVISARLPATLLLMLSSFILSTLAAIWLGVIAAQHARTLIDSAISLATTLFYGMPAFWLGQLLMLVFAVWLRWLPIQGMTDVRANYQGIAYVIDVLRHLLLPLLTLSLLHLALVTRLTRVSLREALVEDYVRTAYAKGLRASSIVMHHALRNALLPVITAIGTQVGTLIAGAVLTEIIFAWPGLGRLLYDSTLNRDYPLLMGIFLLIVVSVILANLVTDVVYTFLDPRIRFDTNAR
jgi:peptide/nickel transport system permease protein